MLYISVRVNYFAFMNGTQMTLGCDYEGQDITGWLVSEKFDGCRAYWDGSNLWTRGGKIIKAPEWFIADLPTTHLDGEIWAGRSEDRSAFEEAKVATVFGKFTLDCRFIVFDAPQASGNWEARMATITPTTAMEPVKFTKLTSYDHMREIFTMVKRADGEGLMLRDPKSNVYETGRTNKLLKVKT